MYDPKKRTRFNWWTPSFPLFESRFFPISNSSTFLLPIYRSLRLFYLVTTTLFHLTFLIFSLPPFSLHFPSIFDPKWTATQRLVYPFLRRIIWALADVGDPNVLTRSTEEGETPWWAWGLEEFTVRIGRGERVKVQKERGVRLPEEACRKGWFVGERGAELAKVNLFWFEREKEQGRSAQREEGRFEPRSENERIVMYLFGGGYVCGSPGEGGRCYKIARETGLRVVGVSYRRATSKKKAFPAALQDVLACYFHLTLDLGYRDIILAGDSAGGGLALNLLQYLSETVYPSLSNSTEKAQFVLPSALLLISPWCDLTLDSFPKRGEENMTDIILPSICSNSVRAYLERAREGSTSFSTTRDQINGDMKKESNGSVRGGLQTIEDYEDPSQHPWFSPALPSSLPALQSAIKAYLPSRSASASPRRRRPLRILLTLGTSELFYPSLVSLARNLEALDETGVQVETMEGQGEVHAFPLVPEWVSPNATKAWERLRIWFKEE
ncbi:hypothetical protein JCM16303_002084 [Sporobolomyces ruberrimus]